MFSILIFHSESNNLLNEFILPPEGVKSSLESKTLSGVGCEIPRSELLGCTFGRDLPTCEFGLGVGSTLAITT